MNHFAFVTRQVAERHPSHFGEFLRGIVGTEGRPVVVGAQVYVFRSMLAQRLVNVHRLDAWCQMFHHVVDGQRLRLACFLHLFGTIVFYGGGNHHAIDVHVVAEFLLILVGSLCVCRAAFSPSAVCHQCPGVGSVAHHDDARVCYLGVLVGSNLVLVLVVRVVGVLRSLRFLGLCALLSCRLGGMECHGIVALDVQFQRFAELHAQQHEVVAVWFAVAEPRRHLLSEFPACQFVPREVGKGGEVALLQFRESASRKGEKHHCKHGEDTRQKSNVNVVVSHCSRYFRYISHVALLEACPMLLAKSMSVILFPFT